MKFLFLALVLIIGNSCTSYQKRNIASADHEKPKAYSHIQYEGIINDDAFREAIAVYEKLKKEERIGSHSKYISIVDFSKHSSEERFYIVALDTGKILSFPMGHGVGNEYEVHRFSGGTGYVEFFSNKRGSNACSSGAFLTMRARPIRSSLAFRMNTNDQFVIPVRGLDKGINDSASDRGIVIQRFSNPNVKFRGGRIAPRSYGSYMVRNSDFDLISKHLRPGNFFYVWSDKADQQRK